MKKTTLTIVLATLCFYFKANAQNITRLGGQVISSAGNHPVAGATIKIKNTKVSTVTNQAGEFEIASPISQGQLTITYTGMQTTEINFSQSEDNIKVILKDEENSLNEIQIIGYGQTTKRLNTGSISSISTKQIEQQPVTNILSALSGQMPGVFVQTTNGLPGGNINIQIRGKGSIAAGTNPLYIIDGVPFESTIIGSSAIETGNLSGAISPLNSLNPSDIEGITVLKDADATAIYGSRGANGVVLITTKKGKAGSTRTDITITRGFNQSANLPRLLTLQEYLQIRKEAFVNDNIVPNPNNAPDLLTWDQSKSTNWPKSLFGQTAAVTDLQAGLSGGSANTNFNASANFHQEGNVVSDRAIYTRGGVYLNLRHQSENKRLELVLSNALVLDKNNSPNLQNASSGILLPPNFPLMDVNGQYFWRRSNPLAERNATTRARTNNIISNLTLSYVLHPDLKFKASAGYNKIDINQVQLFPLNSLFPGSVNYTQLGQNSSQSFILEPQLNYNKKLGSGEFSLLLGGTYQDRVMESMYLKASNFSNEELMENLASAGMIEYPENSHTRYKYVSVFGRATYNLRNKYILNFTIRRDGSSRFGKENRFGNFGSVGTAWLFSEENWLKEHIPILSYGKLRASFGTTGNDQISDYQFLSTYSSSGYNYQGNSTLSPARIDNTDFHWETTRKLELAIELGFWSDRLLLNVNRYLTRSNDQLVQYSLPQITGFASYQANLPAVIQNTGWEFELNTTNLHNKDLNWKTRFNITIPKNKLVSFENFENSSYAQTLAIGYDITRIYGYHFLGVDPKTGAASYSDINGTPSTEPYYFSTIGKQTPDFYGGLGNTFSYKNFTLDLFLQFAKQMSVGGLQSGPGALVNNYAFTKDRWQKTGDASQVPKASTIDDFYYIYSSANYFDASYIRLKNLALGYTLPEKFLKRIKIQKINLVLKAQNLITFWNNNSPLADPESGALSAFKRNIPPVKSFTAGLQLTF